MNMHDLFPFRVFERPDTIVVCARPDAQKYAFFIWIFHFSFGFFIWILTRLWYARPDAQKYAFFIWIFTAPRGVKCSIKCDINARCDMAGGGKVLGILLPAPKCQLFVEKFWYLTSSQGSRGKNAGISVFDQFARENMNRL